MQSNPYRAYIEHEILTADPIKLVQMLYRGALDAVADARSNLAKGDIRRRSAAVTKAVEILAELSSTLDHNVGGELSASLAALYDYIQRRLLAGNREQADRPLADAQHVLETLAEAWMEMEAPENAKAIRSFGEPLGEVFDEQVARHRATLGTYVPLSCAC